MIYLGSLHINAKDIIKLKTLGLHRILISAPEFFLSDEGIDVHLVIAHLPHGDLHRV